MIYFNIKTPKNFNSYISPLQRLALLLACIVLFYSCSVNQKMHVLTCDTSTVDKWLDTSNHIENIILQFNTISLKKTSRHMNVVCYALTNSGYYFDSVPNELVKTEKFSKKINGTAIFGNNVFTTNQLKDLVFDALGHKVVYDYLTFTPYIDINKHIYYLVSASRPPAAPSPPPITSAARTEPCPPAVCATKIGNVQ